MRNLYRRFEDLTGRSMRTVGLCISADFGECTIQYPGGGFVSVKGAGEVGKRYFVMGGRLDGEAQDLPGIVIEV